MIRNRLSTDPRGYYELKGILSAQNQPYYLSIKFIEQIMNSTEIEQASFIVNSENNKEVEFKQDIDITKNLHENAKVFESMKEATGIDLTNINQYNRNSRFYVIMSTLSFHCTLSYSYWISYLIWYDLFITI